MKYLIIGAVVIVVAGVVIYLLTSNPPSVTNGDMYKGTGAGPQRVQPPQGDSGAASDKSSELKIEDEKVGTGAEARPGTTVTVNYVGTLADGTKFDSSYDRGKAFVFPLGRGMVIQGWEQGIVGMKVGGKRKLTIPPILGYGEQGAPGAIPPNATLIFEVELLGVE